MMKKHVGEQPHSCKQYNFTSTFSDALQIHKMTHTGKKPLRITWSLTNVITLAHKNIYKLQKYKMTHTGEKAHIPSLPYTRSKIWYTNEDAHSVEVLQIQPVRLHLHSSR